MNKASCEMIEKFQCPGCINGSNTKCGAFKIREIPYSNKISSFSCGGHCPSTFLLGVGRILLGFPKGFNRPGRGLSEAGVWGENSLIRMWRVGESPSWDKFNVAVWALEQDGFLFVRTFSPRVGFHYIDVIEGGTLKMVPDAVDVSQFIDDMD